MTGRIQKLLLKNRALTFVAIMYAAMMILAASQPLTADQPPAPTTAAQEHDDSVHLPINFIYHKDMDMNEQDVFIQHEEGSSEVWRVSAADRDWSLPLYSAATPLDHAPFDPSDRGPFPRGEPLGLTLSEWFAGQGQGSYTCKNGTGNIDVQFSNLVRDGVYTMWHWFVSIPPTMPFIGTYDLPIGARDGSQSTFRTDAEGSARFVREFSPCLQLSGEHLAGALAVTLHSDGNTYGPLPGEFARDSHVQMFLVLPKRPGL